jgi:hypothetical protein
MTVKDRAKSIIDELPDDTVELAIEKLEELKGKKRNPYRKIIGIIEDGNLTKNIDREIYGK